MSSSYVRCNICLHIKTGGGGPSVDFFSQIRDNVTGQRGYLLFAPWGTGGREGGRCNQWTGMLIFWRERELRKYGRNGRKSR